MTEGSGTEDVTVPGIVRTFGEEHASKGDTASRELLAKDRKGSSKDRANSTIVTARGTADGLVLKIESGVGEQTLRTELWDFMESRRNFIAGNELIIEWSGDKLSEPFLAELQAELAKEFEVTFKEPAAGSSSKQTPSQSKQQKTPSLFDGIDALGITSPSKAAAVPERQSQQRTGSAGRTAVWDDADARIIYGTMRSGQRIETEHSVVVMGDVNSGAEIVAGGDVVVLGCLRGIAHAGAYDETGGGRTIFALNLQPTQLRIGGVISRGGATEGYAGPELARVDGSLIVVEAYQSRGPARR